MFFVKRNIGETTLNGFEYLLDDNNRPLEFETEQAAKDYMLNAGMSEQDIENVFIEEE